MLIDTIDAELLDLDWRVQLSGKQGYELQPYVVRSKFRLMHRQVAGAKRGQVVDHINGNTLDNRRCNLRICTRSQNGMNRRVGRNNTSGVKGVYWDASGARWRAEITADRNKIHLGSFATFEEAVAARLSAEARLHGEFARRVAA